MSTIQSPTTCPTCGTPCTVEGNTTKHYEPVAGKADEMPEYVRNLVAVARKYNSDADGSGNAAANERKHSAFIWFADDRERLLAENAAFRQREMDQENAEASVCPEDVGFVEYIGTLKSALDRAQRERDEAVSAYEKTMIQRDMARNELAGERRSHEMLANLRRNQLLVNAALQKECDAMRKLVTEAIGWDEEAIDGEQLSAAIAEYRASHTLPEGKND